MPANADLQAGSYLFVRPSKTKAGSVFIMRELHGASTKGKFTFHARRAEPLASPSGAGPAAAEHVRGGAARPQPPHGRISPRPAQAPGTEKFSPSGMPALDRRMVLIAGAAKVQCDSDTPERKEDTDKASSKSRGD